MWRRVSPSHPCSWDRPARRRGEFAIRKVREWSEIGRECRPGWIRGSERDEGPPLPVHGPPPPWRSCPNCRLLKQWSLLWGAARRCGCLWNRRHRWQESFGRGRPFCKVWEVGDNWEWGREVGVRWEFMEWERKTESDLGMFSLLPFPFFLICLDFFLWRLYLLY